LRIGSPGMWQGAAQANRMARFFAAWRGRADPLHPDAWGSVPQARGGYPAGLMPHHRHGECPGCPLQYQARLGALWNAPYRAFDE